MKEVKHFICERCKTEYNDKQKALHCEKNHKDVVSVENNRYLPITNDATGYPIEILCKMSDGKEVKFRRG